MITTFKHFWFYLVASAIAYQSTHSSGFMLRPFTTVYSVCLVFRTLFELFGYQLKWSRVLRLHRTYRDGLVYKYRECEK